MTITRQELLHAVAVASAGYFSGNPVPEDRIEAVVREFFRVMASASGSDLLAVDRRPAIGPDESVSEDEIVCIECGKRLRSLKTHLRKVHNLTPEKYREKWGLKDTYPMMPPSASQVRSGISRAMIDNLRSTGRPVGRPRKPGSE